MHIFIFLLWCHQGTVFLVLDKLYMSFWCIITLFITFFSKNLGQCQKCINHNHYQLQRFWSKNSSVQAWKGPVWPIQYFRLVIGQEPYRVYESDLNQEVLFIFDQNLKKDSTSAENIFLWCGNLMQGMEKFSINFSFLRQTVFRFYFRLQPIYSCIGLEIFGFEICEKRKIQIR